MRICLSRQNIFYVLCIAARILPEKEPREYTTDITAQERGVHRQSLLR